MPIGSASIRRASGAMKKESVTTQKSSAYETTLCEIEIEKINGAEEVAFSDSLKKSVEENGVIRPIFVVKNGDKFDLISGKRRVAVLKSLEKKTVKAVVLSMEKIDAKLLKELKPLKEAVLKTEKQTKEVKRNIATSKGKETFTSVGKNLPSYLL